MWSDYTFQAHEGLVNDSIRGPSACLIWRCQAEAKESFYRAFTGEGGKKLLSHPMLVHAFFLERIVVYAYDYLEHFSGSMYHWVSIQYIVIYSPLKNAVYSKRYKGEQNKRIAESG